jgi:hypothetical protein
VRVVRDEQEELERLAQEAALVLRRVGQQQLRAIIFESGRRWQS